MLEAESRNIPSKKAAEMAEEGQEEFQRFHTLMRHIMEVNEDGMFNADGLFLDQDGNALTVNYDPSQVSKDLVVLDGLGKEKVLEQILDKGFLKEDFDLNNVQIQNKDNGNKIEISFNASDISEEGHAKLDAIVKKAQASTKVTGAETSAVEASEPEEKGAAKPATMLAPEGSGSDAAIYAEENGYQYDPNEVTNAFSITSSGKSAADLSKVLQKYALQNPEAFEGAGIGAVLHGNDGYLKQIAAASSAAHFGAVDGGKFTLPTDERFDMDKLKPLLEEAGFAVGNAVSVDASAKSAATKPVWEGYKRGDVAGAAASGATTPGVSFSVLKDKMLSGHDLSRMFQEAATLSGMKGPEIGNHLYKNGQAINKFMTANGYKGLEANDYFLDGQSYTLPADGKIDWQNPKVQAAMMKYGVTVTAGLGGAAAAQGSGVQSTGAAVGADYYQPDASPPSDVNSTKKPTMPEFSDAAKAALKEAKQACMAKGVSAEDAGVCAVTNVMNQHYSGAAKAAAAPAK